MERAGNQRKSWYFNYVLTNDIAFKEIKLYRLADYFIKRFKSLNSKFISQDKNIIVKRTKLMFIFDFLDLPIKQDKELSNLTNVDEIKSIEFKNVYYKYLNANTYALKNISFKIDKGENIALVGMNGSGKTTLVKLLSGFYSNYKGEILINDISIKNLNIENIHKKLGVVFQDYNKYELTCRENIALSKLSLLNSDENLIKAVQEACATEIVENLPYPDPF